MGTHEPIAKLGVGGVALHSLRLISDARGDLSFGEFERSVPFAPKRYFLVFNVPHGKTRGEHAHKTCQQFLICVHGSCLVLVDDGRRRREVTLDSPGVGLFVPSMVWGKQLRYSADAMLLVFASEHYDPDDYIRTYDEFRSLALGEA